MRKRQQAFTEDYIQMGNMQIKICSLKLIIMETQNKTIMKYHYYQRERTETYVVRPDVNH